VAADERACAIIPAEMSAQIATALSTQYCTAYYAAAEAINLFEGDKVLIHAAAGGVGTALMQYARYKKCEIFATAGTDEKLSRLKAEGAAHTINYRASSFAEEVRAITGNKGIDVVFDALGGKNVKQGIQLLRAGGKMICYGASVMSDAKNPLTKIGAALAFGFYHPAQLMMPCKSIIGVNMLRIADEKPETLSRCLQAVVRLQKEGIFHPLADKTFSYTEIAAAHDFIEQRKNTGKVAIIW
jgi:NADPH2:quinone reductase